MKKKQNTENIRIIKIKNLEVCSEVTILKRLKVFKNLIICITIVVT